MSDQHKSRWADFVFLLALSLLASLWAVYPPQRIDPSPSSRGAQAVEVIAPAKQGVTP